MRYLDHPVVVYSIMFIFSAVAAWVFSLGAGSIAEVTRPADEVFGIGFKAGGAVAGFMLIFYMSGRAFSRLDKVLAKERRINMKLHLVGDPEAFDHQDSSYMCKYSLFDEGTGDRREFDTKHRWEAGYLTLDVREVGANDLITVRIENDQNKVWECDFFHSRAHQRNCRLYSGEH